MATIAQIASGEDFSILLGAVLFIDENLEGSDLVGALSGDTDLTVFAPNNAAFGQLAVNLGYEGDPAEAEAVLGFLATNVPVETLNAVVLYHVLPGAQFAADIAANPTLTTLQGATITADLPTLVDNEPDLIDPSLVATDIAADNGVVHVIDQVLLPIDLPGNDAPTITEVVLTSGAGFDSNGQDFDLLREAVVAANLAGALNDPEADLTVFAPNDAAFVGLAQTLGFQGSDEAGAFGHIVSALRLLSDGGDPIPLLEAILLYHVAPDSLQASQVLSLDAIPTLLGADLGRDGATLIDADPDLPDPSLIATDIQAGNGIIHVLDGVLIPADVLVSDGSNDVDFIIAGATDDDIRTGRDDDFVDGGAGHDDIRLGKGDDVGLGGDGNDYLAGNRGDDILYGDAGSDQIRGGRDDDEIYGGDHGDLLWGNKGDDMIFGGSGKDVLRGATGHDTLDGGDHNDALVGGKGGDMLFGGSGRDGLYGGHGHDTLDGGSGFDFLIGGQGSDVFVFDHDSGFDIIGDFDAHEGDKIDLSAFNFDSVSDFAHNVYTVWNGVYINLNGADILLEAHHGGLSADDFIL